MISFRHKGDFRKATRYLERIKGGVGLGILDKYGREALEKTISDAVSVLK